MDDPTIPKPVTHVKLHTLPKLVLLVQAGVFPLVGAVRAGHVIAEVKRFKLNKAYDGNV